jgi:hypothetical protein
MVLIDYGTGQDTGQSTRRGIERNKTSYKEGKKEETRDDGESAVFMYRMCVTRKREGLALVSVVGAEP